MIKKVRPKKQMGQHFLKDEKIAEKIANSLTNLKIKQVVEIGPGTGALTKYLFSKYGNKLKLVELDSESVAFLQKEYPLTEVNLIQADFLKLDLEKYFETPMSIIGNFPYHISNLILFKCFENRNIIDEISGMFQREVARRITASPGNKEYGILSVLLQAFYDTEYLFTVDENVFIPPPKVKSGIIRLKRNSVQKLNCNEKLFVKVVKTTFNQRRKTIRNSIKQLTGNKKEHYLFSKRPEQLNVNEFVELTNFVEELKNFK